MANKILFKTSTSNDSTKLVPASGTSTIAKAPGTVYFTKDGKIIYDLDDNTRLIMSDYVSRAKEADKVTVAVSADLGTGATKLIRTFMASALWEGNTLYLKDASGNNLMSTDLGTKFLPLTAGPNSPLTGDLYFNADNNDRAIHFNSSSTAHHWRIAYLGSGTGNANYLAF